LLLSRAGIACEGSAVEWTQKQIPRAKRGARNDN
jgi:hypothetical protein